MIVDALRKLTDRQNLSRAEAAEAMTEIMTGRCTDAQISAFIVALRMKGETVDEIAGCAEAMRAQAAHIDPGASRYDVVDTCGTGGDRKNTLNISTAAALVAAGAGCVVAKHGNKSVSSRSGSADVLEALGVNIKAPAAVVERCMREAGVGFLFAPLMHAAMKHAIGPRREIAVRTIFNILGPLTNPARARCQVMGVYAAGLAPTLARVLAALGAKRCLVVHGEDGMDEITITGRTRVAELAGGSVREYDISPEDFSMPRGALDDLLAESPEDSANSIRAVLGGAPGPQRNVILLNAAAAILAAGAADAWPSAIELAARSIDQGAAKRALETLIRVSNAC